jgi:hypothetical protein
VGKRTSQHANAEEVVGLSLLLLPFFFVTFALVSTAVSPTIFCLLPFPLAHLFRSFGTPPAISFFFFLSFSCLSVVSIPTYVGERD